VHQLGALGTEEEVSVNQLTLDFAQLSVGVRGELNVGGVFEHSGFFRVQPRT